MRVINWHKSGRMNSASRFNSKLLSTGVQTANSEGGTRALYITRDDGRILVVEITTAFERERIINALM